MKHHLKYVDRNIEGIFFYAPLLKKGVFKYLHVSKGTQEGDSNKDLEEEECGDCVWSLDHKGDPMKGLLM